MFIKLGAMPPGGHRSVPGDVGDDSGGWGSVFSVLV